jgi:hypothetical protein
MKPRTICITGKPQLNTAIQAISLLPIGEGLEVVIQKTRKARTPDQSALMFAGPLKDISEQAWVDNRQFSVEVWHEYFKAEFLPDENSEPYIHELVKSPDKYRKWGIKPDGDRILTGSTTELSKYGFSQYLEQIYAYGAKLGVLFHANARDFEKDDK